MLNVIFWDPDRAMMPWNIPFLERPLLWYGFFFALGFFLAYFFLVYLVRCYFDQDPKLEKEENKQKAKVFAEKALVYSVVGTLVGARLGDVLFYQDWQTTLQDPLSVLKIWEGGLASHGGALGVLIAFWLFFKQAKEQYSKFTFKKVLDLVCIPIAMVGGFIRLGNFFNQEILGTESNLPWAVVFGHPADGSYPISRHPAQLYECLFYFLTSLILYRFWKKDPALKKPGKIISLFLVLVFGFRFLIESVKEEQSQWLYGSCLTMGQWLSIPFILAGLIILCRSCKSR